MDIPPFHQLCMVEPVTERFHQFSELHLDLQILILSTSKETIRAARALNSYWREKALEKKLEYDTLDYPSVKEVEMYLNIFPMTVSFLCKHTIQISPVTAVGYSRTYCLEKGEYPEYNEQLSLEYSATDGNGYIRCTHPLPRWDDNIPFHDLYINSSSIKQCVNIDNILYYNPLYDLLTMKWIIEYRLKLFDVPFTNELIKKYTLYYLDIIVKDDYLKGASTRFLFLFNNAKLYDIDMKDITNYVETTNGDIKYNVDEKDTNYNALENFCSYLYNELVTKIRETE